MEKLIKYSGFVSLYQGLAYLIGIIGFIGYLNVSAVSDPSERVSAVIHNAGFLTILHLVVYVFWGVLLVILVIALFELFRKYNLYLSKISMFFGIIWATLIIASGFIYTVGIQSVSAIQNPEIAMSVWLSIEAVFNGLGGGNELIGSLWVLLNSYISLKHNIHPKLFNYLGYFVSLFGILTVVPAFAEFGAAIFGLSQIIWFFWLGILLIRYK